MPKGTQIVQYSLLDTKLVIWLVSPDSFGMETLPINRSEFESNMKTFATAISGPENADGEQTRVLGRWLYNILFAPVRDKLDARSEICIVPTKDLFGLSFGALISPSGKPLIGEFNIVYAPSANVYINSTSFAKKHPVDRNENLLAIGNPSFDRSRFADLDVITESEAEVKSIATLYPASKTLIGESATTTNFLSQVSHADVVHFAGHYVTNPESPMASYMLLAEADSDDGILTNGELSGLRLDQTKLIVLAACRTGVEAFSPGEGMAGLSRTFLAAKVPLVVASRWKVDSAGTSALMTKFHSYRSREHLATTVALRRAQLDLIDDQTGEFNSPYYWAAFSVFGGHAEF